MSGKVAINTVMLHCHLRPPFLPLVLIHEWKKTAQNNIRKRALNKDYVCQERCRYGPPTSVVLKVEKATCINAHHRLIASNDVNAEWIQLQMNDMLTEAKSYLILCLLYQCEAATQVNRLFSIKSIYYELCVQPIYHRTMSMSMSYTLLNKKFSGNVVTCAISQPKPV